MSYSVVWATAAENTLAEIWMARSDSQRQIQKVMDQLETDLSVAPFNVGESRDSMDRRFVACGMLGVAFQIDDQVKAVKVIKVWEIGKRQ